MNRSPLLKVSIRYGLVAGVLSFVLLIALYYMGRHPLMIAPYLDFRILLFAIFIFFCAKEVREYYQQGEFYFWQGMVGGGLLVFVASAVSSFCLHLFGLVEKDFVLTYVRHMTEYLKTFPETDIERIGKSVYESNLRELPATKITQLTVTYFAQGIAIGFFVTIILSAIVRRQQPKN